MNGSFLSVRPFDIDQDVNCNILFYCRLKQQEFTMSVEERSDHQTQVPSGLSLKSRAGLALTGFLIVAGVLLFTEHRAHVLGLLVWLPLLACPLMHIFMHGGHGHHGTGSQQDNRRAP